jgi:hypothetical protein
MISILKLFLEPTIIVAIAMTWIGTGVYHRFTAWINQEATVKAVVTPWRNAVEDRDRAVKFKDELIIAISKDKERGDVENAELREKLEKAEAARRVAGTADCVWSASDRRMLNSGTRAGAPAGPR